MDTVGKSIQKSAVVSKAGDVLVKLTVNGKAYQAVVDSQLTLLDFLRNRLGLMGAKNGCGKGQCGACTVIVDGRARRSCTSKVARLDGAKIETIEGLAQDGVLHPLQLAFLKTGAIQCGFCTPGMVMAAKALLDQNRNPAVNDIKEALKFNLCRCTGYIAIIQAVQLAAAVLRGEAEFPPDEDGALGKSVVRKDALKKVTGQPIYADDLTLPGLLYGKILYSDYPYAEIVSIDTSEAEKSEGVAAVATAKDVPGRNTFGLLNPNQQFIAEKRVLYIGDSLAVVYAETPEQAEAALRRIKVEYKPLNGIFTPEEAMREDAPLLYEKGKTVSRTRVRRGDVEKGFAECDVIIEADYEVPFVEHAYMEPESALASLGEDGVVTVRTASQGSYPFRDMIAETLNMPPDKVRIIGTPAGGAFGGKEEPTVQLHCALGALLTGRPVKITMTREESIRVSTKRHAEKMHYKLGASKEGKLLAFEANVIADTGAYDSLGLPVVFRSGVVTAGPYAIPNVKIDSAGYYTNNPPGGAFRGFGSTQVTFAAEVHMDMLARRLNMDPFKLREINGLSRDKETITGQLLGPGVGYLQTLTEVKRVLERERPKYKARPGKKIGVGIASSYKNVGIGAGKTDKAGAVLELDTNGDIWIKIGAYEMGQGSDTVMAQFASEVTKIPYEKFIVINNDTFVTPDGEETTASRQTFITGNAVVKAAEEFALKLKKVLKESYGLESANIIYELNGVKDKLTGIKIGWREVAQKILPHAHSLRVEYTYVAPKTYPLPEDCTLRAGDDPEKFRIHFAYCFATQAAIVEVDETTGEVKVLKIIAATDLGKTVNPLLYRNQVEGGVVMGMGYALYEEFIVEKGRIVTDNLAKLKLPKITQVPEIEVIAVEDPDPDGPFGAKGMGELPVNPTAPAIANAIYDAVGVRINALPITREKILQSLSSK